MKSLLLFLLLSNAYAIAEDAGDIQSGIDAAKAEHRPALLDFYGVWCTPCYEMRSHVMVGAKWKALEKRVHLIEVDVDSPDGSSWAKKLTVTAPPTFVLLQGDGTELGRIVGAQTTGPFFSKLGHFLAADSTLSALQAKAKSGSAAAAAAVLEAFQARRQFDEGVAWFSSLPSGQQMKFERSKEVRVWLERLRFDVAAIARDEKACIEQGTLELAENVGCDRPVLLQTYMSCTEKMSTKDRQSALLPQRAGIENFLKENVFVEQPTCGLPSEGVWAAARLYKVLGDEDARKALLSKAVTETRKRLDAKPALDRALATELTGFLEASDRFDEENALLLKLIPAFPDDFVAPYNYGNALVDQNKPSEALQYFEQANRLTYGKNRIMVAKSQVEALLKLDRRPDAEKVVAETLGDGLDKWFPERAQQLRAMLVQ